MRRFFVAFIIVLISTSAWAETIKVAGSGGMIPVVTDLAVAYMAKNPHDKIDVVQESIEAKGGIMGAYEGRLDIGMSARLLTAEEIALGLSTVEIARIATVVGVNAESVKITSIKSSQVCGIYSGQIKNWKELGGHDAPIKAFTRPEPDATKGVVRKGIKCFSKLAEASHVVMMPKSKDMYNALLNNPNAIGFTDMDKVDDSQGKIRALILDGIAPTEGNVKAEKWPITKNFVLVTKGQAKGLAARFIDFIKGSEGSRSIVKNKAVPVK